MIKNEFPLTVVEQLLNAIRLNSYEARQRFPRLLQIVELYSDQTIETFIKSTSNIPCWMFLGWLSQMTALLDKPEARAVNSIVLNIANDYPQAFVYPFRMSLESFKFDYASPPEQKEFVDRLKSKMNQMHLANQFVASLEQLTNPNMLFQEYAEEINKNLKNREYLIRKFQELFINLIEYNSPDEENTAQIEWGVMKKNFAKFLKPHFVAEFGQNGKLIVSLSDVEIGEKLKTLKTHVSEYTQKTKEGGLGEYSPWLKNYKRNG